MKLVHNIFDDVMRDYMINYEMINNVDCIINIISNIFNNNYFNMVGVVGVGGGWCVV